MKTTRRKISNRIKIVGATLTAIFSLFSVFTATYAWFATNQSVTATGMQLTVKAPDNLEFELYYLSSFEDESHNTKDGNINSTTSINSGYEVDYEDATFTKINYSEGVVTNDPNPTNIDHLWPAHKLTFAAVIANGSASKLSLTDWNEGEGEETAATPKTSASQYVRLSWAIDIYGAAYSVADSGNDAADVATAYASSYYAASKTDVFTYSESNLANETTKEELDVIGSVPALTTGYKTILFFTIEFSNANSTFYRYNSATSYYVQDSVNGNSNCYERLALNSLEFKIK